MEKEIKNFDRRIEQIMNENSVAPPFGMWNRISSELEAEALPIAAAAPLALIPKRAMVGFIAGVAVIGLSLVTAYIVSNNSTKQIETTKPIASIIETTPSVAKTVPSTTANVVIEKASHIKVAKIKTVALKATQPETGVANETSNDNRFGNNTDVSVPNQAIASNQTLGNYYFPPVDIMNPVSEPAKETVTLCTNQLAKQTADEKTEEKNKTISSSSSEKRITLKKHRRGGWGYGSLNRLRKHRTN